MKRVFEKKHIITGGFGLALLLLFSVGAASYLSILKLMETKQWVDHTHQVLETIDDTTKGLQDAERGRRGYVITSEASYLETYKAGIQNTKKSLQALRQLTGDNPQQQQNIKRIEPLVARNFRILQQSIDLFNKNKSDSQTQITRTNQGRDLEQQIQEIIAAMDNVERDLLLQRIKATDTSIHYIIILIGIGYFLSFSLLGTNQVLLQKEINNRKQVEAALRQSNNRLERELKERQLTEVALLESEEKFRQLAENIQNVFWISNPKENQLIYVSPAYEEIWGRSCENLYKNYRDWIKAIHPQDRQRVETAFFEEVYQGAYDEEYRIVRPDGSMRWVKDRAFPIKNESGEVCRIAGIAEDITKSKRAEEALRESEVKFRSLCERSPIGIFMMDAQGQCTYTNPRVSAIWGCKFDGALGDSWVRFTHPDDRGRVSEKWLQAVSKHEGFFDEVRYLQQDGTICWGRVWTAPIFSAQRELLSHVGVVEDVTESRAIEQMKNEFISIVSHELRTPLASIRGALGLLAAGVLDNQPETAKQMLEIASIDTERLVRLVNDILDLERLESNKVNLVKQWCDAATLMQQCIETLQPIAEERNIAVSFSPTTVKIWAAPDRIIQVLVNLVSNAIKFSPPDSKVMLAAIAQADRILFQVKDQGRGIPAEQLETIFGRFEQIDASDSRQKGGTGLGLAICRSIVQQHGGKIWVESILGKGSIFCFTLPMPLD